MAIEGQDGQVSAGESNQPSSTPGSDQGGQQPQGQQPQAQQPQAQQPDRRDAGLLADLQRERKARQAAEARHAQYEADLASERRRVQALAGVTPQSPEAADQDAIRQQFSQLFPGLAKLNNDEMIEKLQKLLSSSDMHEETTKRYWSDRAAQMTNGVIDVIKKELGGDLSERQVRNIRSAYASAAERNPEFLARHEEGDPTLITEFAKEFIEDWFEPARRKVTQQQLDRNRNVPQGRDRSFGAPKPKAIDFKNEKSVEDALVESYRAHGGAFKD